MFKFFVTKKAGEYFLLDSDTLQHIKVVRLENEPFICVYKTIFYFCRLEASKARIIRIIKQNNEYRGDIILAIALIDKKRFEWLIEKATELGVKTIIPMVSQNVSRQANVFASKFKRFKIILKSAAQQAFRNRIPTLEQPQTFHHVVNMQVKNKFLAHEKVIKATPSTLPTDALLVVGPEGGFTNEEVDLALKKGFLIVSLGKTILKSETAALSLLSKLKE